MLIELRQSVPPEVLRRRPGIYVAYSLTPGYGALLGAVASGDAAFLGEHIDPCGVKGVAAAVGRPLNPAIGIAREFFTTVLRDYSDWQQKWWREAIQNSVDAGATKIMCEVHHQKDGTVLVAVDDNGSGMDEHTLVDKFLMLGGSTKFTGETAGGFGKAKELLILPWLWWHVRTGDVLVEGSGVEYTLERLDKRRGTRLAVQMPADQYTDTPPALAFISKCYLPKVRFEVIETWADGSKQSTRARANLRGKDLVLEIPDKCNVYTTKVRYEANQLYVRVKGLFMFEKYVPALPRKQLIAEVTAPSVEIFTANRDGFRDWDVRRAIDQLAERMAKDVMSALRSRKGMIHKKYQGLGKFRASELEARALGLIGPIMPSDAGVVTPSLDNVAHLMPDARLAIELLDSVTYRGAHHVSEAVKQLVWQPDFFVMNDIEGFRVPKKFLPEAMTPRVIKLARTWTELCRFVLMQLGEFRPFGVGFCFTEYAAARYLEEEDEHWLLLNPYVDLEKRKVIWSPTKKDDLQWLYAAAVHECTHLADGIDYHDESFAAALTRNLARTADGFRKVRKIVGAIRMAELPVADTARTNPRPHAVDQAKARMLAW